MNVIYFRNNIQAALFKAELSGQISDGMWENTRPNNHWKPWCKAEVGVNPESLGVNFYSSRNNYNFSSKMLLDVVGDRMIWAANLAEKGYEPAAVAEFYDIGDWVFAQTSESYVKKSQRLKDIFGTYENLDSLRKSGSYDRKKLTTELNDMKAIIKKKF